MGILESLLVTIFLSAGLAATALCEFRRRQHLGRTLTTIQADHQATIRLLRLAATDQRNIALTLLGHAQQDQESGRTLCGLSRRLLDLSEDLTRRTETPDAARHLAEEPIPLMPVLEFAMAQVASHLGPSRRAWRLAPSLKPITLLADRRALNQVLVNVLSGAAASTRDGDWIDISPHPGLEDWSILIQDEGIGLPIATTDPDLEESRGIGLQLTLARSLMQAHGGNLTVESTERVGTRVRLSFPANRLRTA